MKRTIEIIFNIIFWIVSIGVLLQLIGLSLEEVEIVFEDDREIVTEIETNLSSYFYYGIVLKMVLFYWTVFYLIPKSKKHLQLVGGLLIAIIGCLIIELLPLLLTQQVIATSYAISTLSLYGFYEAVAVAYGIIRHQIKSEQATQQLANEKLQTELKLLRSQINPHFLFNALNNLLAISEQSQNPIISKGISQLSELLRFLIYDAQTEFVPLHKEIEFIESFIALQQLRYASTDEVAVELNVIGVQQNHQIAPALLIPFVENAFKHGVKYSVPSPISIFIEVKDGILQFEIENRKHQKIQTELEKKYSGVGLENVKKRLALRYHERYHLKIDDTSDEYKVTLTIEIT